MKRSIKLTSSQYALILIIGFFDLLYPLFGQPCFAEGSGNWGTASDRWSWLWVPANSSTSNTGYGTRGFMMLPSNADSYNPDHRFYVYVKNGETVYWGFRKRSGGDNMRVRWLYDNTDTSFFPTGTGADMVEIDDEYYDAGSDGSDQGRPGDALEAANGPDAIVGTSGYDAFWFTNNTGADRAFWVEISDEDGDIIGGGFQIDYWDITVANSADEVQSGRVYCKYWSVYNGLPSEEGVANSESFHDNFGFFVPVDDTFGGDGESYFVKYAHFGGANGGYVNFFANADGPRNDQGSHTENRKSISGTSSNYQYPLFLNDPDHEFWPTTDVPTATLDITYQEKVPSGTGGEAWVEFNISLPGIVDVLIDLNGNGVYDGGVDIIMSESYDAPGDYQIYWDGEDANGNVIVSGSQIEVFAAVVFAPVHFPVYDMEQSLGITITNVRPGDPENNDIYWDDSEISVDNEQSLEVNVTGEAGTSHIWYADGNEGFGNENTINTWAASYYAEVNEEDGYRYLTFQGNVFDDEDGLDDNLVSGLPTLATGLYALIVDASDLVVASAPVLVDGTYTIDRVPDGIYKVILSTVDAVEGAPSPAPSLPENFENSGEQLGTDVGVNLMGEDGVLEAFNLNNTSVVNANFGLRILAALPVVWEDWQVGFLSEERNAFVKWAVSREWECSHYEVERSVDGVGAFDKIGEVQAVGWADELVEYEFNDVSLPSKGAVLYYRIKQVDLDGEFSYSDVRFLKIPDISSIAGVWKIYPNPVIGNELSVEDTRSVTAANDPLRFRLVGVSSVSPYMDVLGEEMLSLELGRLLEDAGSGFYLLEIQWDDKIEMLKLIKR